MVSLDEAAQPTAAHLGWDSHVSPYSHHGCPISVVDESKAVNPVTVVFVGADAGSDYDRVKEHAKHHGGWKYDMGNEQNFYGHGICAGQDKQANSNIAVQLDQYHMRLWTGRAGNGSYNDFDFRLGQYTLGTPHHENVIIASYTDIQECGANPVVYPFTHAVYDDELYEDPIHGRGGFIHGREDIWLRWYVEGDHSALGYEYWGNVRSFRQGYYDYVLDDCWWASNRDGKVLFVRIGPKVSQVFNIQGKSFF
jgi:hypothetical protein